MKIVYTDGNSRVKLGLNRMCYTAYTQRHMGNKSTLFSTVVYIWIVIGTTENLNCEDVYMEVYCMEAEIIFIQSMLNTLRLSYV